MGAFREASLRSIGSGLRTACAAGFGTAPVLALHGLPTVGLDRLAPAEGAFYVYADVSHLTDDSPALCARWLDELGIASTPGTDFDPWRGHEYVRFSFCGASEDMERAIELLAGWQA